MMNQNAHHHSATQSSSRRHEQGAEANLPRTVQPDWAALKELAEHVHRKGFGKSKILFRAQHEIRSLAAWPYFQGALSLLVAGDKMGHLHAALCDSVTGTVQGPVLWFHPGYAEKDPLRVVDQLEVLDTGEALLLVVGTRGLGAWWMPLDALRVRFDVASGKPAAMVPEPYREFSMLPGSEGLSVRCFVYDSVSRNLWCGASQDLLAWKFARSGPSLLPLDCKNLGFRITALGIDTGSNEKDVDHLYVATNQKHLFRIQRSSGSDPDSFPVQREWLQDATQAVWSGRLSVIENLIPLSRIVDWDEHQKVWRRRFPARGVLATTLRHLLLLYSQKEKPTAPVTCHLRLVVAQSKVLAVVPLNLPRWQGMAVATLEPKLRLFRPSGLRQPEDSYRAVDRTAPENQEPQSLLSGFEDLKDLPDRIYVLTTLTVPLDCDDEDRFLPVVAGFGDHAVRWFRFEPRWQRKRKARALAVKIVQGLSSLEEAFCRFQYLALHPEDALKEKNALATLLPVLGARCEAEDKWASFEQLVWDILAGCRASAFEHLPNAVVQALRELQDEVANHVEALEEMIFKIRKYVMIQIVFLASSKTSLS